MTMFIKVEGIWHQANAEETATLCGLDPQDAENYGPDRLIRFEDQRCQKCVKKAASSKAPTPAN